MGGVIHIARDTTLRLETTVVRAAGRKLEVIRNGQVTAILDVAGEQATPKVAVVNARMPSGVIKSDGSLKCLATAFRSSDWNARA